MNTQKDSNEDKKPEPQIDCWTLKGNRILSVDFSKVLAPSSSSAPAFKENQMSKVKTWLLSQKPLDVVTVIFLIGIVVAAIVAAQTGNLGALISLLAIFWSVLAHHKKSTDGS